MNNKKKLKIGDEVFYSLEDYNTGEDVIYKGTVKEIKNHKLKIKDKEIDIIFYDTGTGIGCERKSLYTLEELFEMKNRLEYLLNEIAGE